MLGIDKTLLIGTASQGQLMDAANNREGSKLNPQNPWLGAARGELWNGMGSEVPSKPDCSGVVCLSGFRD